MIAVILTMAMMYKTWTLIVAMTAVAMRVGDGDGGCDSGWRSGCDGDDDYDYCGGDCCGGDDDDYIARHDIVVIIIVVMVGVVVIV